MKKKICVVTGTRADYGIYYPVLSKIKNDRDLQLSIVATGMHLMKEFGYTVKDIEEDGFKVNSRVDISYSKDTGEAMAYSVGQAVGKFAHVFNRIKPDIVVVLGDRGEMFAAAVAANYLNIPVAHIHGGEISGHVDGILRHAITKLSHIHFAATRKSAERIISMGEDRNRVYLVGAPALDRILKSDYTSKKELRDKYGFSDEKLILVIQHPVLSEIKEAAFQMKETMYAAVSFKLPVMVIYPNADAGGRQMIAVIKKYSKVPYVEIYKSIPHRDYLGVLRIASVIVGNSSSAIIEAPSFNLPAVNIGSRQAGREQAANVINVNCKKAKIKAAIKKSVYNRNLRESVKKCKNPYGNGTASDKIVKIISGVKFDLNLMQKRITY
ncbi:MAG: UDP-N-acetylglucosamine 2-epimerase (hydrolyzing) [Candidatus Omnitrophica bacterium]|nr:UDP-N-acetylglucosamine 2-epimerase (hydrolyzing) [Candidatus Omnitrophota bacterium]MBU3929176.1 UDP-N-acetylglucosamine 2-epimerase (hydrolyzing) [bacterium]